MYQIDVSTAVASAPGSTSPGTAGFFTDGNPLTATPATVVPAEWLNSVMRELLAVVVAGGVTPHKAQFNNLLTAIQALAAATYASQGEVNAGVITDKAVNPSTLLNGFEISANHIKLPTFMGGLIIQWGKSTPGAATGTQSFPRSGGFPAVCYAVISQPDSSSNAYVEDVGVRAVTTTEFTYDCAYFDAGGWVAGPCDFWWIAVGK